MHHKLLAFSVLLVLASTSHAGVVSIDPAGFAPGTEITRAFKHVTLFTLAPDFSQGVPVAPDLPALKYIPVYAVQCSGCPGPLADKMMFGTRYIGGAGNPNGDLSPIWWSANLADMVLSATPFGIANQTFNALFVQFDQPTDFVQIVDSTPFSNFFRLTAWDEDGKQILTCANLVEADEETPTPGCSIIHGQSPIDPVTLTMHIHHPRIAFVTAGGWAGGAFAISMKYNQLGCGLAHDRQGSDEKDIDAAKDSQE